MIFGVVSHSNMTTSLCFDGLRYQRRHKFARINPFSDQAQIDNEIREVDAVVISRHLYEYPPSIWLNSVQQGKPTYYLSDDNFVLLRNEMPELSDYTPERFRSNLRLFNGVLAASQPLVQLFESENYHNNVALFGIVRDAARDPSLLSKRDGEAIHVGCFGGSFRVAQIGKTILPALKKIRKKRRVRFYARNNVETLRASFDQADIELITFPATDDVNHFLKVWRGYELDVVIHPSGDTANLLYKNANALLVSYYLGAVPIVMKEPAYSGVGKSDGITFVEDRIPAYVDALDLLSSRRERHDMFSKLEVFVKRRFDPESNLNVLDRIAAGENFAPAPRSDLVSQVHAKR